MPREMLQFRDRGVVSFHHLIDHETKSFKSLALMALAKGPPRHRRARAHPPYPEGFSPSTADPQLSPPQNGS